jgi:hypothetical protein
MRRHGSQFRAFVIVDVIAFAVVAVLCIAMSTPLVLLPLLMGYYLGFTTGSES